MDMKIDLRWNYNLPNTLNETEREKPRDWEIEAEKERLGNWEILKIELWIFLYNFFIKMKVYYLLASVLLK